MIISQTSQYALRALVYLYQHNPEKYMKVRDISRAMDVPDNYLSKIFHSLSRAGVLESSPGKAGGFRLAVPADKLHLSKIMQPFEPASFPKICLLGQSACSDSNPCSAHSKWKKAAEQIRMFLETTTLEELAKREDTDSSVKGDVL